MFPRGRPNPQAVLGLTAVPTPWHSAEITESVRREVITMSWSTRLQRIRRYMHQPYFREETTAATYADLLEGNIRLETVAEHSWVVADWVLLLAWRYPYINASHAVQLAVLHDKMEIYIGDLNPLGRDGTGNKAHAFAPDARRSKEKREQEAIATYLARIEPEARSHQRALLDEALHCNSPESRYVKALDKMSALIFILQKKEGALTDRHLNFLVRFTAQNNMYFPPLRAHSNEMLRLIFAACAAERETTADALFEDIAGSYEQLPLNLSGVDESPARRVDSRQKPDRLMAVVADLEQYPLPRTGIEAVCQLHNSLNRVEDEVWGDHWAPPRFVPPGTRTDRMYPVACDSTYPVEGWAVDVLVSVSELVFVSARGAMEMQQRSADTFGLETPFHERRAAVRYERPGADGSLVWDEGNRLT